MSWNGLSLQTELSALLSDDSTAFKARISSWANDIEQDMCTRHNWGFTRQKGKKLLTASVEEQSLLLTRSTAPTVAIASGGSLTSGSSYKVITTFYESVSGAESQGTESASVTADSSNKTINITAIPVSSDVLVTSRKIYVSKDGGAFYYVGTISDNTTTIYSITSEPTSKIEAPDIDYIIKIDGQLFIENSWQLRAESIQSLRQFYSQNFTQYTGTPNSYAMISHDRALVYPTPTSGISMSYYYFKYPRGIYPSVDSIPTIPFSLKQVLVAGVEWKGYQYRDRDGKESCQNRYESLLQIAISKFGSPDRQSYRVRDVTGSCDGFLV